MVAPLGMQLVLRSGPELRRRGYSYPTSGSLLSESSPAGRGRGTESSSRTKAPTDTCATEQRSKHFQCSQCHKKMATATALKSHMLYVHKEQISAVPNARAGRDNFDFDVIGMDLVQPPPTPRP